MGFVNCFSDIVEDFLRLSDFQAFNAMWSFIQMLVFGLLCKMLY